MYEDQIVNFKTDEVLQEMNLTKGETEVFGTLISLGGSNSILEIRKFNGSHFKCKVSKELAIKMGSSLYKRIALYGTASWNRDTLDLVDLKVKKYEEITQTKLSDVREKLGDKIKTKEMIEHVEKSRREDEWL